MTRYEWKKSRARRVNDDVSPLSYLMAVAFSVVFVGLIFGLI